ncbi:MAG: hypothetical protein ACXWX7_14360 [Candidatus Binatia bacterium]
MIGIPEEEIDSRQDANKLSAIGAQPIKPARVATEHRRIVGAVEIAAREQLVDLMTAFLGVETSWGKSLPKINASRPAFCTAKPKPSSSTSKPT